MDGVLAVITCSSTTAAIRCNETRSCSFLLPTIFTANKTNDPVPALYSSDTLIKHHWPSSHFLCAGYQLVGRTQGQSGGWYTSLSFLKTVVLTSTRPACFLDQKTRVWLTELSVCKRCVCKSVQVLQKTPPKYSKAHCFETS